MKMILLAATLACIVYHRGYAQNPVTLVYTHTINATTQTTYTGTGATGNGPSGLTGNTYTYKFGLNVATTGNKQVLDSFIASNALYRYQSVGLTVNFRRVNNASVTSSRKSMWYDQDGGTVNPGGTAALYADYDDSLERVFTGRYFDFGIDNVFQNAVTTNNNNIERMDVVFSSSFYSTDNTKAGFAVFDRGPGGQHDSFYVAAIATVDGTGAPLTYYNAVLVTPADYGFNVGPAINYLIMRKNPTDARLLMMDNSATQNRDGVFLTFSDLGVPSNTKIMGYSLLGTDVSVKPAANMVQYTNATIFPTGSDFLSGGLDPVAITGLWTTNSSLIVLPDWFNGFTAEGEGDKVQLNWGLGVTDHLKELAVERSADGVSYAQLSEYAFEGTVPRSMVDAHPLPGKNYYRLCLIDDDKQVSGYSTISMAEVPVGGGITMEVRPNPVSDGQVVVDIHGLGNQSYELAVFDMQGKCQDTYMVSGDGDTVIGLPRSLAQGLYVVRLSDETGRQLSVKKIMITAH